MMKRLKTDTDTESPGCDGGRAGEDDYIKVILEVFKCWAEVEAI